MNLPGSTARHRRLIAGLVQRAIDSGASLLATDLDRYAAAEGLSWEQLARSLRGTPDDLNQVALCRPPSAERFIDDVQVIAGGYVDADRLLILLRQIQVLGAFSGSRSLRLRAAGPYHGAASAPSAPARR